MMMMLLCINFMGSYYVHYAGTCSIVLTYNLKYTQHYVLCLNTVLQTMIIASIDTCSKKNGNVYFCFIIRVYH